jgi:hypothetical protein
MSMVARAGEAFRAAWPLAGVGLAVAVNGVWIGVLGYGISKFFLIGNVLSLCRSARSAAGRAGRDAL